MASVLVVGGVSATIEVTSSPHPRLSEQDCPGNSPLADIHVGGHLSSSGPLSLTLSSSKLDPGQDHLVLTHLSPRSFIYSLIHCPPHSFIPLIHSVSHSSPSSSIPPSFKYSLIYSFLLHSLISPSTHPIHSFLRLGWRQTLYEPCPMQLPVGKGPGRCYGSSSSLAVEGRVWEESW